MSDWVDWHSDEGVSPVIGSVLLVAIAVILVSLVAFGVTGFLSTDTPAQAGVSVDYESESVIAVQLTDSGNTDEVFVRSALGTRYQLSEVGDTQEILNIEDEGPMQVIAVRDGKETLIQTIEPHSFQADIVVNKDVASNPDTLKAALDAASAGDIIVVKKGTYYENINITTDNITIVGEEGTVIADNSSDSQVVDVDATGVRIANVKIDGSTSKGGAAADYGVASSGKATVVSSEITGVGVSETTGSGNVVQVNSDQLVIPKTGSSSGSGVVTLVNTSFESGVPDSLSALRGGLSSSWSSDGTQSYQSGTLGGAGNILKTNQNVSGKTTITYETYLGSSGNRYLGSQLRLGDDYAFAISKQAQVIAIANLNSGNTLSSSSCNIGGNTQISVNVTVSPDKTTFSVDEGRCTVTTEKDLSSENPVVFRAYTPDSGDSIYWDEVAIKTD